MGGQQEVTYPRYVKFTSLFNLANNSYLNVMEQTESTRSRMHNPDQEIRVENLVTSYEAEKERFDLIHPPDTALINHFLMVYGRDLSDVNIHTGSYAEEITHKAGAEALTSGKDIYFSSGSYAPHTEEGEALLLHEVEHVNQNKKGQKFTYREDVERAEKEAYSREGLKGQGPEDSDLFEKLKQNDIVFKDKELTDGLDAADKDLEDFTNSEPIEMIRYISKSGRIHEMTKQEYRESLAEIKEKLEDHFEERMMYSSDEERIQTMHKIVDLFGL